MSNKHTEYSNQELNNLSADTDVSPPIPRRGMLGKDSSGNWRNVLVGNDGGLVAVNSAVPAKWDYVTLSQDTTTDTYVFKTGGSGGTTVSTIVITYTDSGKQTLSTVEVS